MLGNIQFGALSCSICFVGRWFDTSLLSIPKGRMMILKWRNCSLEVTPPSSLSWAILDPHVFHQQLETPSIASVFGSLLPRLCYFVPQRLWRVLRSFEIEGIRIPHVQALSTFLDTYHLLRPMLTKRLQVQPCCRDRRPWGMPTCHAAPQVIDDTEEGSQKSIGNIGKQHDSNMRRVTQSSIERCVWVMFGS